MSVMLERPLVISPHSAEYFLYKIRKWAIQNNWFLSTSQQWWILRCIFYLSINCSGAFKRARSHISKLWEHLFCFHSFSATQFLAARKLQKAIALNCLKLFGSILFLFASCTPNLLRVLMKIKDKIICITLEWCEEMNINNKTSTRLIKCEWRQCKALILFSCTLRRWSPGQFFKNFPFLYTAHVWMFLAEST